VATGHGSSPFSGVQGDSRFGDVEFPSAARPDHHRFEFIRTAGGFKKPAARKVGVRDSGLGAGEPGTGLVKYRSPNPDPRIPIPVTRFASQKNNAIFADCHIDPPY